MNRIIPPIAMVAILFLLASCQHTIQNSVSLTESGYPFFHHINNDKMSPGPGDYAYCYIDMRNGDRVINTNRTKGQLAKLKIEPFKSTKASPIMDAVKLMSVGDSLTVHYPLDNLSKKPKGFENADYIAYDIKLVDIKSDASYQSDFRQKWEKATATIP